ncbi:MAG: hypothetical protein AAF125_09395, partial [Chloroflexota bacterium]
FGDVSSDDNEKIIGFDDVTSDDDAEEMIDFGDVTTDTDEADGFGNFADGLAPLEQDQEDKPSTLTGGYTPGMADLLQEMQDRSKGGEIPKSRQTFSFEGDLDSESTTIGGDTTANNMPQPQQSSSQPEQKEEATRRPIGARFQHPVTWFLIALAVLVPILWSIWSNANTSGDIATPPPALAMTRMSTDDTDSQVLATATATPTITPTPVR